MSQSYIQVSEPLVYSKNQCINIQSGQGKMICLLKGKLKLTKENKILCSGEAFGLEHIINMDDVSKEFVVLEDATIVSIEGLAIEGQKKDESLIRKILVLTVEYIYEVRENLIKGTTSCRP